MAQLARPRWLIYENDPDVKAFGVSLPTVAPRSAEDHRFLCTATCRVRAAREMPLLIYSPIRSARCLVQSSTMGVAEDGRPNQYVGPRDQSHHGNAALDISHRRIDRAIRHRGSQAA